MNKPHSARNAARRFLALACFGLLVAAPVQATDRYDRGQLASLPAYCSDSELVHDYVRFGPRWQYWVSRMGRYFNSIHHYCQGMLDMQTARRWPKGSQQQMVYLKRALNEYNYLLRLPEPELRGFPLWPEMLMRRGEAAVLMGDWVLATASYEQARRVKPDYWPAYLGWAEVLVGLKLNSQARDLIKQGLLIDPSVESMRQAYTKLGGSLADIPPPKPPAQEASAAASSVTPEAASGPASGASL